MVCEKKEGTEDRRSRRMSQGNDASQAQGMEGQKMGTVVDYLSMAQPYLLRLGFAVLAICIVLVAVGSVVLNPEKEKEDGSS